MNLSKYIFVLMLGFLVSINTAIADDTKEIEVNGVKVIIKKTNKKVVTTSVIIKGGTANYTKEKEGVEQFAFNLAAEGGTKAYDKTTFNTMLEKMGSSISANTSYDYGSFNLVSLKRNFEESWKLLVEVINNPLMNEEEFELLKNRLIAAAQQTDSNPDAKLRNNAMVNSFSGLPYANISGGTEESLTNLTLEDVQNHFKKVMTKSDIFMVIVGDVEVEDITAKVEALVSGLPEGEKRMFDYGKMNITKSRVTPEKRDIKTNYVRGYMDAPKATASDRVAMQVGMSIVRDRLFEEIRTKRNLSYAPQAYLPSVIAGSPYVVWYVSTDKPNESIQVMYDEINKLRTVGFSEKELKDKKAGFLTRHFMREESGGSQAMTLALAEMSGLGWENTKTYLDDVNALTIKDLNQAFKKYSSKGIDWTYLGDDTIIDESVFTQAIPVIEEVMPEKEKVIEKVEEVTEKAVKRTKREIRKLKRDKRKKSKKTYSN